MAHFACPGVRFAETMMSNMDTTGDTTGLEATDTEGRRKGQAKQVLGQAGQALKQEAQTFASAAQERARTEAQKRAQTATKTLGDFANAIRRAGDELAANDQSPASQLVRQAADGLENLSRNLSDKQPEELLDAVRDFGRRHPAAFIGGAVLAGIALGRFVRASERDMDFDVDLSGTTGSQAYPMAETAPYAGGPAAMGDEAMGLTGATGTDAEVMAGDTTSVLGVDEGGPERRGT